MGKKNSAFIRRFHKQLLKFIRDHRLFELDERLFIAVSGGVDSMVLLEAICSLKRCGYSNDVVVLHVNHGTRPEQKNEEKLVRNYCRSLGVEFRSKTLSNMDGSDFENRARQARYAYFQEQARGAKILLGQHIDDSLEWTFMQQLKSSNMRSILGIPAVNKNIRRPLMAFSRAQILSYARQQDIPFNHDPTNETLIYERNRMRKVLGQLKADYPSALKNYVQRHNELAHHFRMHIRKDWSDYRVYYGKGAVHVFAKNVTANPIELKSVLREVIHNLSGKERGSLVAQLDRAVQMVTNNKFGPLSVVGGLEIYNCFGHILIKRPSFELATSEQIIKRLKLPIDFTAMTYTEFEKILKEALTNRSLIPFYPLWVIVRPGWVRCPKAVFPTHASLFEYCKAQGLEIISAGNLLKQWSKKDNIRKSLSLHFV